MIIRKHRSSDDVTLLRATSADAVLEWERSISRLLASVRSHSLDSRRAIPSATPPINLYQPHSTSRGQSLRYVTVTSRRYADTR